MRTNYHTHTTRCLHATGSDEEFVLSAIKGGYLTTLRGNITLIIYPTSG